MQKVLRCLPKTSLKFSSPISRGKLPSVAKMMEGILSSFISSTCCNISTFAFLLSLCGIDIVFSQRQLAKRQCTCISTEDELKFFLTGFSSKNSHSIMNNGMCQWWQLLQATEHTWTQSWSSVVKVLLLFNRWKFSVSGEKSNLLFSKDVYSPSTFLGHHPLPSEVFHFAHISSSLMILSAHSMIKFKKNMRK